MRRYGRPYRTVFEPTESRKPPEKRLIDLLIEHYDDELDRVLAMTCRHGQPTHRRDRGEIGRP
jgi:hypothetical protein